MHSPGSRRPLSQRSVVRLNRIFSRSSKGKWKPLHSLEQIAAHGIQHSRHVDVIVFMKQVRIFFHPESAVVNGISRHGDGAFSLLPENRQCLVPGGGRRCGAQRNSRRSPGSQFQRLLIVQSRQRVVSHQGVKLYAFHF